jgi:hypothetical protein
MRWSPGTTDELRRYVALSRRLIGSGATIAEAVHRAQTFPARGRGRPMLRNPEAREGVCRDLPGSLPVR